MGRVSCSSSDGRLARDCVRLQSSFLLGRHGNEVARRTVLATRGLTIMPIAALDRTEPDSILAWWFRAWFFHEQFVGIQT